MRRRFLATLLLALLATVAAPARAAQPPAADFLQLYDEYQRSGAIGGCSYRAADLRAALAEIPADIEAYDPGFADALSAGLEQRAAGCEEALSSPGPPAAAAGAVVAADGSPGPAIRRGQQPASAPVRADTSMPVPLIALAALVSLAVLVAAGMEAIRRRRLRR